MSKTIPPARILQVQWEDPAQLPAAGRTMSGLAFLEAIRDGRLPPPPIGMLIDMSLDRVEKGSVGFSIRLGEQHYNPMATIHGGIPATMLDSAMGCAVHSMLEQGSGYATLELKVNIVRPMTAATGTVFATGSVIHLGRTTATAEGRLVDAAGKLYAHATTTCMIFGAK